MMDRSRASTAFDRIRCWFAIPTFLLLSTLAACSGDEAAPVTSPPPPPSANGTLTGRVIASDGTGAIPNATIEVGTVQTTSGADGSYSLSVPSSDRATVRVGANGFAENIRIARVVTGQTTSLTVQLVKVGVTETVGIGSGGTIRVPGSAAQVVIPANGLIPQTGGSPAANVAVSVTPINVATRLGDMPGDFTASSNGSIVQIESFGAMLVDARDSSNVRYSLVPGNTATIRIPVSTRTPPTNRPLTIPLFYFDNSTGRWVQEGQATLVANDSAPYYEGSVSRLSYWNADLVTETIVVTGCVRNDAGQPVANALVESDGITYSGSSRAYTATDGSFQIPIRKDGQATITAFIGSQLTNTATAGPVAANIALESCLVTTTSTGGFNIKLTWGAKPSDLDSHLFAPNAGHVYFIAKGSLTALPFARLDVDNVKGFGPEVVTISQLMQGRYQYVVHNFSSVPGNDVSGNPNLPGRITDSPTRVELTHNGTTTLFTPTPGEGANLYYWHVVDIVVDAQCNVSVTPVNAWLDQAPTSSPAGTPVFCTVN